MNEQFIPYELALELKELGFDEKCFKSYRQQIKHEWYDIRSSENITFNKDEKIILSNGKIYSDEKYLCDAPLWQQAFDWLFHKYSLNLYLEGKDSYQDKVKKLEDAIRNIQNNKSKG